MRRVMDIRRLLALSLLALGFDPYGCPVDCGRGLEPKAKSQKPRAISSETPANRVAGLRLCSHPGDAARRRACVFSVANLSQAERALVELALLSARHHSARY